MIGTTLYFEAGHRQLDDIGKCGKLHGHNWKVEIKVDGEVNNIGYIIDFKEFKNIIEPLDHSVILNANDELIDVLRKYNQKVYVMEENPTCENISELICYLITNNFEITGCCVKVWENHNSWAEYEL